MHYVIKVLFFIQFPRIAINDRRLHVRFTLNTWINFVSENFFCKFCKRPYTSKLNSTRAPQKFVNVITNAFYEVIKISHISVKR